MATLGHSTGARLTDIKRESSASRIYFSSGRVMNRRDRRHHDHVQLNARPQKRLPCDTPHRKLRHLGPVMKINLRRRDKLRRSHGDGDRDDLMIESSRARNSASVAIFTPRLAGTPGESTCEIEPAILQYEMNFFL
ncbi:hypothetical protein GWG65_27210 [Bradyrhizobium sp. CSA207]|uniref:hypothetical protein n=1 Tax=Bradyrhizobium sp. CSA207 TaxID=2698826 RepID=UPI0023AFB24C|nr:hypothetical protein [Bradyrhizobium sp. CSA207]MDE5445070.1 hypothetical protein [Bradyrhizobium sp. CSA207]